MVISYVYFDGKCELRKEKKYRSFDEHKLGYMQLEEKNPNISLSTKHAAKPPSGLDPPFSGVWRSSPASKMIFLSSFIYGCSSWWFLGCSPATSLPHQVHARLRNKEV